ncbi:hypothetical protein [Nocardioides marmorisolisilvae]|nr:hypothetical protein [Nocardioides marmorisolisilvae]
MAPTTRRAPVWSWAPAGTLLILGVSVLTGPPAYFISFLFAYGFRDHIGVVEHGTFLVLIALYATATGLLSTVAGTGLAPIRQRATFGVRAAGALNATAIGIGSVVSSLNKDQGSVSADFSPVTDVAVAGTLFFLAATLAVSAFRTARA